MFDLECQSPRILVIQNGARHAYQVPLAFERAGALSGVYTDMVATKGIGWALRTPAKLNLALERALSRRIPPPEISNKVSPNDIAFVAGHVVGKLFGPRAGYAAYNHVSPVSMWSKGFGDATHIYSMFGEGGTFVELAKSRGLGIIGDVYIAISSDEIVAEETALYPDWADEMPTIKTMAERIEKNRVLLTLSDHLICPSPFVQQDLIAHGVAREKIILAPYAVSPRWLNLENETEPGRVLFAGTAIIRKGIHTLALAAKLLEGRCRFVVAGRVSTKVRNHPDASALSFLGHLGPNEMADEFARADVFAFPSLAEGSAGVTGEALGAGLPVVTTLEAGAIVRDGIDGHIIPARDPQRLAEAIASIVEDREMRSQMSRAARERAQDYDWDRFARSVLRDIRR